MAEAAKAANTAVPTGGDTAPHDRVVMLSLDKSGQPDQFNPEIIGDKQFAVDAAKRQFAEQAVSAVDDAARSAAVAGATETVEQDPSIKKLQAEHDKAAGAAEKRAASVIDALHK